MTIFGRRTMSGTLLGLSLTAVAAAQTDIPELAPERSFLIVGVDDAGAAQTNLMEGQLGALWRSEEVQGFVETYWDEFFGDLEGELEELDLTLEELPVPQGTAGLAAFLVTDEETGQDLPGVLVAADYGDAADRVGEIVQTLIEQAEDEDVLVEEIEVLGRRAYKFSEPAAAEEAEGAGDEMGDEWEDPFAMGGADPMEKAFESMYLVRADSLWVLCSNLDALTDVLARLDGDDAAATVADDPAFQNTLSMVGRGDVYGVMLVDPFFSFLGNQPMMMMMGGPMLQGPLGALGLSKVDGLGFSVDLTAEGAILREQLAAYVDGEKTGLLSLLTNAAPKGDVPAFVGPDVSSFYRFNFEFGGLMDVIRGAVQSLPEGMREQAEMQLTQIEPMMKQFFSAIGPEVYVVDKGETIEGPLGMPQSEMFYAIKVTKPDAVESFLAMMAPGMQLMPRDFLGQTIYANPDMGFAAGTGGGYLFLGLTPPVEQALRATGQADVATLAGEAILGYALRVLPEEPVIAWGYDDTITGIEQFYEQLETAQAEREAMEAEAGGEAEGGLDVDDFGGMPADPMGPFSEINVEDLPSIDVYRRHLGPSSFQIQSVDNGFLMTAYLLPPRDSE